MKRGGQCFNHAKNIEQAKHGSAGLALARGPLAQGEHWHPQIIGGFAFI